MECSERIDKAQVFLDQEHIHTISFTKGMIERVVHVIVHVIVQ